MARLTRRTRRLGVACLVVAAGVSVLALLLGRYVAPAVSAGVGASSLVLALAAFDAARTERAQAVPLAAIADDLAAAVFAQWQDEDRMRALKDPCPLPVSWEAAEDLAEDRKDTANAARGRPGIVGDSLADSPKCPAAEDGGLAHVLDAVPTGSLIVLGEPGSGKTTLLLHLVLDLLGRRVPGNRVPVLLSLASWDPTGQSLHRWLADQLTLNYDGLSEPAPSAVGDLSRARALLDRQFVLPVLDGLDEIPAAVRPSAIDQINAALDTGDRLVVASRTKDYPMAARPADGRTKTVPGAAAVVLRGLDHKAVKAYLVRAGDAESEARWEPVLAALDTPARDGGPSPVAKAFRTPLAVSLARAIYNPRPGEQPAASPPRPAELCDTNRFPTRKDIERHLFGAFIRAVYKPGPDLPRKRAWTAHQAEQYLTFLARYLQCKRAGTSDFAWWALGSNGVKPTRGVSWSLTDLKHKSALRAAAIILALGLLFGLTISPEVGLGGALGSGLILALAAGLKPALTNVKTASGPGAVLARDRGTFLTLTFIVGPLAGLAVDIIVYLTVGPAHTGIGPGIVLRTGLVVGPAAFVVFTMRFGPRTGAVSGLIVGTADWLVSLLLGQFVGGLTGQLISGLLIGAIAGLLVGVCTAPWGTFTATRCWLAIRRQLPWHLMGFLADARQRAVLRQAGAVYQFRHTELQHCLAAPPQPAATGPVHRQESGNQLPGSPELQTGRTGG
jgi:hypothetical protein